MDISPLLSVKEVTKVFPGTIALSHVSLDVFAGEVLGIMGENGAGKSTLINILSGNYVPDFGKIYFNGQPVRFNSPREAQQCGIATVHQELSLCPHLSVAENVFMGRIPVAFLGLVNYEQLYQQTSNLLTQFGDNNFNPQTLVSSLSVSNQQIVEIAKALSFNCKVLIFDEPTSSLSDNEVKMLFSIISKLKSAGIGIVYITHKLNEVFTICDRVAVLRDGKLVETEFTKKLSAQRIVSLMVGRQLADYYPPKADNIADVIFSVSNLSSQPNFENISFDLHNNEVLGIFGLIGSGRTEIAQSICGIDSCDSGRVFINDRQIMIRSIRDAINQGLIYLTEDRKAHGLFLQMSIQNNIVSADLKNFERRGFLDDKKIKKCSETYAKLLKIRYSQLEQQVEALSGGNQQKVLLSNRLAIRPKVIILDEPTRGIDVGAKAEIHAILRNLAREGVGVIIISSELPEILGMSDRVLVINRGRIVAQLSGKDLTEENIMAYASGL